MRWYTDDLYKGSDGIASAILNLVFFLNVLTLLGLTLMLVMRGLGRGGNRPLYENAESDPLELARLRLAMGEITEQDFEAIRERLQA
ncbi:MAG: SHOCT domain-containing protein [Anaerolineales bacterium]